MPLLLPLLLPALVAGLQPETTEPRLMRYPCISGDTVVFTYAGDLWVVKTSGGIARRLTSHPGVETRPHISPDGRTVAFTGQYDGLTNIYTIPIEGGEPKRLTYDVEPDTCLGWTPDGKIAYISTAGNFINRQQRLWYISPNGGLPERTVLDEVSAVSFFPDGKTIALTRNNSFLFNWRHYRGGSQGRIGFYNFPENKYWELPSKREQSYWPMVVGNDIYYTSDRNTGVENLYRYDRSAGTDVQVTHYPGADVRTPSTDGKTIVYERDGLLYLYDIKTGVPRKMDARILSENLSARPYLRPLGNEISNIAISPSGVRVAVEARGNIFSVPVKQGETRNLTDLSGSRARYPAWSPDGKTIAYVSDESGNYEIYTKPQLGGPATRLTTTPAGMINQIQWSPDGKTISFAKNDGALWLLSVADQKQTLVLKAPYAIEDYDWSPDSKWISYISDARTGFGKLYLYDVASGKTVDADDGSYSDTHVAFDLNGKYLYISSNRSFHPTFGDFEFSLKSENSARIYVIPLSKDTPDPLAVTGDEEPSGAEPSAAGPPAGGPKPPKPPMPVTVKVDVDGIAGRILPLPMPPSRYLGLTGAENGVIYYSEGGLSKYDFDSRTTVPILQGPISQLVVNPAHTKIAYLSPAGLGVVDAKPGNTVGQGKVSTAGVEAMIDPRKEWKQMFWEAWRYERDYYYDPKMRGLDWTAIGKHYATYLQWVNNRADLSYVLGLMISELGTSHSYVIGGDMGPVPRPIPVGQLGADYDVANGHIRFAKIYRGRNYDETGRSPLAEPGVSVHEGDYLLAINDTPLDATTNPSSLLLDAVDKYVVLTVNSTPSETGARKVRVRPIASEAQLRYFDFVDRRAQMVAEMSHGRIGYMHIRDTADTGAIDFIHGFYPQADKEAMIVDERWNGGGYPQPWFVDTLARKALAYGTGRNLEIQPLGPAMDGPKAMLINGYAGSGGDLFPWMFRASGLGPLIGTRTWGGLVGISEQPNMVDGGIVTAPEFAIFDPATRQIIAENTGIDPDIEVDRRPDLVAKGQDPEIEAAVKYLMAELAKHPRMPNPSQTPAVNPKGRIGG